MPTGQAVRTPDLQRRQELPFYPEIEQQDGTRRPSFRNRSRFNRVLDVKLRGEDIIVTGQVLEAVASTLYGDWQFGFVIAEATDTVRHPGELGIGAILSLPNLADEFLLEDPARVTPGSSSQVSSRARVGTRTTTRTTT